MKRRWGEKGRRWRSKRRGREFFDMVHPLVCIFPARRFSKRGFCFFFSTADIPTQVFPCLHLFDDYLGALCTPIYCVMMGEVL